MPVSFLSLSQRASYGQYAGDTSTQELARHFHLDDADHAQIVEKRGAANRLGFALQLTTVRFLGTFLEDPTAVPTAVMATMTRQLVCRRRTRCTGCHGRSDESPPQAGVVRAPC
jgi:TnpA family transposase